MTTPPAQPPPPPPGGQPPAGGEPPGQPPAGPPPGGQPPAGGEPPGQPPAGPPPGGQPPGGQQGPGPSSDERNWAVAAHLSALVAIAGIPSLVGPLIVWLIKRDQPFVNEHGREALNFNISVLIYLVVGGVVLTIVAIITLGLGLLVLIPAVIAVLIAWLVFVIQAAARASRGEMYRYPLTIRLIN